MSTHKHFDKICCVVLALTLIIAVIFVNAEKFGVQKASTVMGYEKTLFDNSKVHTIDIVMDDWDEFTANARSEEYYTCSVIIDGEAYKNVAIRGKGNTSLSSVTNDRYSYKIEFDHYDNTNTYHGLDKLCLNNIIQDNTYMKDYLTYTMMNDMGAAAPLCSYAYITINGEDWGLYLAVEGVEESFLQRNYGKDYGELYKPDSLNMGGGRGNGEKFDMDEFMQNSDSDNNKENEPTTKVPEETTTQPTTSGNLPSGFDPNNIPNGQLPDGFSGELPDNFPEGMTPPDFGGNNPFGGELPEGMTPPDFGGSGNPFVGQMPSGMAPVIGGMSKTNTSGSKSNSSQDGMLGRTELPDFGGENPFNGKLPEGMTIPTDADGNIQMPENFSDMFGDKGGFGGMDSSEVKLQYIDDNISSYSNIFESAKTDITDNDKTRLIEALKKLSNGEDLENTVDIDAVIRYFTVHNFVVNSDSYTGSMIHNYYLYEKDGQLQMIPWDYNLAFGIFMAMGSATGSVNDPIDTPLSVIGSGDRPMIDWIFSNEEYTELYHKYFNEFIEKYFVNGYFENMIDSTTAMIAPYVEKDPTKFCTYEEFRTGVVTLREFCLLRAESVKGQLDGTIGSTSATQVSETLIDASGLDVSTMGTMGGKGGGMNFPGGNMQKPSGDSENGAEIGTYTEKPSTSPDSPENSGDSRPQMPDGFGGNIPSDFGGGMPSDFDGQMQRPDNGSRPDFNQSQSQSTSMISPSSLIVIGVSVAVLGFGLVFVLIYKRRKH